ncbi:glycosyltransferase family 2 protein [Sediminitomix flava]|uniref:Glycosyltransferase involved in cell wall biosynthesis n=1 Tax=Sediminitomix flava TaxID=379075 RepID=A0A315Z688_SEDFL|nr:glycosyltransferase family 2 protein [Sediminitomix flava]PWJ39387.1 glycosyltransferase involved in cell wall biosynthesis [Sediminitomix flava]
MQHLDISIVVPLLNEEESLPELVSWISKVMTEKGYLYEVILVDDGSTDRSWEVIKEIQKENLYVKGISFLRNYGKSAALHSGFQVVQGDVVITMDADLQDSPDEIPDLYRMIMEENYDLVSGWKKKRYDPITKTVPTKIFNAATRKMSGIELHDFNCGLKAYKRDVVKNIEVYGEMHRYIPVIAKWVGFKNIGEKVVQHRARQYGVTKFGLSRFMNGFLDLLSISFVSRFKKKPMHFFGTFGVLSFIVGFGFMAYLILDKMYRSYMMLPIQREVVEQPLFFLAITAIIIGTQLFLAGFLAELIALNTPNRNDYKVKDRI